MSNENGIGICEWETWVGLSEDQKQFETHRLLTMLNARTANITKTVKWYASLGGFIGGSVTVLAGMGVKMCIGG